MNKSSFAFIVVVMVLIAITYAEIANTTSNIPPVSRTGAPMEGNCAGCHSGNFNTGNGEIIFSMEGLSYIPDSTYSTTLQVQDSIKIRFGFQLTVLDSNNNMAGNFTITNSSNTSAQSNVGRGYVNHKGSTTNDTWTFDWTAPDTNVGPVTFYICGNATNNNSSISGDNVYMRPITVQTCGLSITDSIAGSYSDSSGAIDLTVSGGIAPFTYSWSNGSTLEDLSNLDSGDYTVVVTDGSGCTETATINIPIWISLNELKSGFTFEVFPNPSSGQINIQSSYSGGQTRLSVFNVQGQLVYQESDVSFTSNHLLDLSSFKAGIYTIAVSNEKEVQYKKVVIQ